LVAIAETAAVRFAVMTLPSMIFKKKKVQTEMNSESMSKYQTFSSDL